MVASEQPLPIGTTERRKSVEEATAFLQCVAPGEERFSFQTFDDQDLRPNLARILHGSIAKHAAELARLNAAGAGIYVTVNQTDLRGRKKRNVVKVRDVFVDLDGAPLEPAIAFLKPTVVVETSPERFHVFWRVRDVRLEEFADIQKALLARLGGDPNVHDLPRVMRLPSFDHMKAEPHRVRLVSADPEVEYSAADIRRALAGNPFTELGDNLKPPIDVEARLAAMRHRGEGEAGIHMTQLQVTASLMNAGEGEDQIVERVLTATRAAADGAAWNWDSEEEAIRGMCRDWAKKHPRSTPVNVASLADAQEVAAANRGWPKPQDLWGAFTPPELPAGLLPRVIDNFARVEGATMGVDPAGLALSALVVCGAAIPDDVQLQPKKHADNWTESARIWGAIVAPPSGKKTPIIRAASRAIVRSDVELHKAYVEQKRIWDEMSKEERAGQSPPRNFRLRIEDTTIEAAQEVLRDSPNGVLSVQDELSGWFGGMDKYNSARGAARDRGFWLQSYNGGPYALNRISRSSGIIPNLSVSILGGIQIEPMRQVVGDSVDDGLLQRFLLVVPRQATVGRDEPTAPVVRTYGEVVEKLLATEPPRGGNAADGNLSRSSNVLRFDDDAQSLRQDLERHHLELQQYEVVNRKLAAHIGKYDGIFARLCVIWHCVENVGGRLPVLVSIDTARRVSRFLHEFLRPHATSFYTSVVGVSDDHERLTNVAGYILAHKLQKLTNRDIQRGDRTMRALDRRSIEDVFDQLDALGWLRIERRDPLWATVNPEVHRLFRERAEREAARRARIREMIAADAPRG